MWENFITSAMGTFLSLFPIANPISAIPIFYSLTASDTHHYRGIQARWTAINVIWILTVFLVAGRLILEFFGISLGVLRIAGGLLVAHTAWEMVAVRQRLTESEGQAAIDKEDISFTPMAVPLVSGPGAIGVAIGQGASPRDVVHYLGCFLGIMLLGITLYLFLSLGEPLLQALKKNTIGALNRVLGFFILAIAVQLIADGVFALLQEAVPNLMR
jgi:multiple antibiotic resistance protein